MVNNNNNNNNNSNNSSLHIQKAYPMLALTSVLSRHQLTYFSALWCRDYYYHYPSPTDEGPWGAERLNNMPEVTPSKRRSWDVSPSSWSPSLCSRGVSASQIPALCRQGSCRFGLPLNRGAWHIVPYMIIKRAPHNVGTVQHIQKNANKWKINLTPHILHFGICHFSL